MAKASQRLTQLEKEALERRIQFTASLQALRSQLTLPGLVDDAVGILDPQAARLRSLHSSVKGHPVIATGVLAGAAWLLAQALHGHGHATPLNGRKPTHRRKRVRPQAVSSPEKELTHEIE